MDDAVSFLVAKEVVFKAIQEQYGNPDIPSRPEGFETLCKLILEQQVSLESARACYLKLENFLKQVTPATVINATEEELRICTVSRQKIIYLKALSKAVLEGLDLESLSSKSPDEVKSELIQIKGIGHWTIDVYLMFSLRFPDVIPLGDIAITGVIKELFGVHDKQQMEILTQKWSPHRTAASFFLWHYYLKKRGRKVFY